MDSSGLTNLELDILLLFYSMSDQYGKVDVESARAFAKHRLGIVIPDRSIVLSQKHIDILTQRGFIPDVSVILQKMKQL